MAAGKIAFGECLQLVRTRAEAMHDACLNRQGAMSVVLGLSEEAVVEALGALKPHPLWIANLNCPEQVVIAGAQESMPIAAEALKEKGAKRVLPLDVSGAFHSGFMQPAQELLAPRIAEAQWMSSSIEIVMNVPGGFVRDLSSMRRYLFEQVVSPVRWEMGVREMMRHSMDAYLEMGPGKTLSGMNKRIGVGVPTLSVEKVSDLESLVKYMEAYAIAEC
jgi:[acyl-carrier-protein] S-malonyltransferase